MFIFLDLFDLFALEYECQIPFTNFLVVIYVSSLLVAAYSVAISAGDSEYLADIFRDIADSLSTAAGRAVCEAQEEVLQICDQLYLAGKISENQLLYLRHLVLIRDDLVATIYDKFQEAGPRASASSLAKALYDLVNSPLTSATKSGSSGRDAVANADAADDEEDDSDEDDDNDEDPQEIRRQRDSDRAVMAAIRSDRTDNTPSLLALVSKMISIKVLTVPEGTVLLQAIRNENEYVLAAYELYTQDGDLNDFRDTLKRYVCICIQSFSCV